MLDATCSRSAEVRMLRLLLRLVLLTAGISLVEGPGFVPAATVDEVGKNLRSLTGVQRKTFLEDGARKEGEVSWYTSMSLTDFPKIVGAFEKSYPYIKI